jgi:AcrR family transcriptional regulator
MTSPNPAHGADHSDVPPSRRGRPRDPRRSRAIVDAARELLREGGWNALTIEAVASRAGVGRPTVYRRWPTKGHLAAEVLGAELDAHGRTDEPRGIALPDGGSLPADLRAIARALLDRLVALEEHGIHPGVIAEMALDADLAHQVRAEVLIPDRDRAAVVVERAIERGEVSEATDPGFVIDSLAALVVYFLYLVHEPVGEAELDRIVELVTRGCLAGSSS